MKICIMSDIHGNYEALKQCVNEAKKLNIKKFICLGDYLGYYYDPDKCIDLLLNLKAVCIKGNHENMFLDILKNKNKINYYNLKYGNGIKIAYKKLTPRHINFVKKLSKTKKISINGCKFLLCHGAPWNTNEYIYPDKFNFFKNKFKKYKFDFIFLGHSHIKMIKKLQKTTIINPGSVGQPRQKDSGTSAKWLLLDTINKKITFKSTKFDYKKIISQVKIYDKSRKNLIKCFKK